MTRTEMKNAPGIEMSCHADGSLRSWKLLTMSLSKGNSGLKKSDDDRSTAPLLIPDGFIANAAMSSGAYGSMPPIGRKLLNEATDSAGGGEGELVAGEAWLKTPPSRWSVDSIESIESWDV